MGTTICFAAYQQLVHEDIEWLEQQPATLERAHILAVLRAHVEDRRHYEIEAEKAGPDD